MNLKKIISSTLIFIIALSSVSAFAVSDDDFSHMTIAGDNYLNNGMYIEARDEYQWLIDMYWENFNENQQYRLWRGYSEAQSKCDELYSKPNGIQHNCINCQHQLSFISQYNNNVYSSINQLRGKIISNELNLLPSNLINLQSINTFAICSDYIYYTTGGELMEGYNPQSYLYRCKLDGSDNQYLANNLNFYSTYYISDGYLYYISINPNNTDQIKGIIKLNLTSGTSENIYPINDHNIYPGNININYCNKDYIYFHINNEDYYRINTNGHNLVKMSKNDMENSFEYFNGNNGYSSLDGKIYKYNWNKERIEINTNSPRNPSIDTVIGNDIYYYVRGDSNDPIDCFKLHFYKINDLTGVNTYLGYLG